MQSRSDFNVVRGRYAQRGLSGNGVAYCRKFESLIWQNAGPCISTKSTKQNNKQTIRCLRHDALYTCTCTHMPVRARCCSSRYGFSYQEPFIVGMYDISPQTLSTVLHETKPLESSPATVYVAIMSVHPVQGSQDADFGSICPKQSLRYL